MDGEDVDHLIDAIKAVFSGKRGRARTSVAALTKLLRRETDVEVRPELVKVAVQQMRDVGAVRLDGGDVIKMQAW